MKGEKVLGKLKVGVIGCGSIATIRHLPEYAANPYTELAAVCDVNQERAQQTADLYQTKAYTDYQELFANEDLDIVSVCTPNYLHAQISIGGLEAGCNVLCEKPMATSSEDAQMMIEAAKRNGKKLMIAHNQRFVTSHQKAKELIAKGEIGKVVSFRTSFGHPGPENWSVDGQNSWFFRKHEAYIGAMGDLGVHKADLIRFILSDEVNEVAGFVDTLSKKAADVDDNAVCILRMESGAIGTLAASWSYQKEDNSTVIYGEKAVLRLEDHPDYSLTIHYQNGEQIFYDIGGIQTNDTGGQFGSQVIDHFVWCIQNDEQPESHGEDAKKSIEVVLAALESSESKSFIPLHRN